MTSRPEKAAGLARQSSPTEAYPRLQRLRLLLVVMVTLEIGFARALMPRWPWRIFSRWMYPGFTRIPLQSIGFLRGILGLIDGFYGDRLGMMVDMRVIKVVGVLETKACVFHVNIIRNTSEIIKRTIINSIWWIYNDITWSMMLKIKMFSWSVEATQPEGVYCMYNTPWSVQYKYTYQIFELHSTLGLPFFPPSANINCPSGGMNHSDPPSSLQAIVSCSSTLRIHSLPHFLFGFFFCSHFTSSAFFCVWSSFLIDPVQFFFGLPTWSLFNLCFCFFSP